MTDVEADADADADTDTDVVDGGLSVFQVLERLRAHHRKVSHSCDATETVL